MRRPAVILTLMVVVASLVVAACSGSSDKDVTASGTAARGDAAAAQGGEATDSGGSSGDGDPSTTTSRPATGSGQPVTLAFAGDSSFQNQTAAVVASPSTVLSAIAPVLSGADVAMVNLETALGTGGSPQPKTFTFQVPAQAIDALQAAGVDAVTMANNHGMDFGTTGLQDTLRIKKATGFPILGVGADENEAYTPFTTEVKGQRIGILAANDIFDDNLRAQWTAGPGTPGLSSAEEDHQARLLQAVKDTRSKVDTLVVYLHMGTEKEFCPNPRQKELATLLTDAGVDIVIGSHTHRVQGVGYLGDRFVAYGLGNFIFKANSPEGAATGVLLVTATGRKIDGYEWKPAVIRNSIPFPLTGPAAAASLATMDQRQACADLSPTAQGSAAGTAGASPTTSGAGAGAGK